MQVPGPFEYERATSVDHAIGLLDRLGDGAMLVAGGHSLLPMMKLRIANPEYLVDINDLVRRTRLHRRRSDARADRCDDASPRSAGVGRQLAAVCPIFRDAERVIADPVVRNRGTVGGSLCQADPAEDLTTVCTVLNAVCLARGPSGEREIPIDDFLDRAVRDIAGAQRDAHRDTDSVAAQHLQRLRQGGTAGRRLGGDGGRRRGDARRRHHRRGPARPHGGEHRRRRARSGG